MLSGWRTCLPSMPPSRRRYATGLRAYDGGVYDGCSGLLLALPCPVASKCRGLSHERKH